MKKPESRTETVPSRALLDLSSQMEEEEETKKKDSKCSYRDSKFTHTRIPARADNALHS